MGLFLEVAPLPSMSRLLTTSVAASPPEGPLPRAGVRISRRPTRERKKGSRQRELGPGDSISVVESWNANLARPRAR